jgi:hypothetical protein
VAFGKRPAVNQTKDQKGDEMSHEELVRLIAEKSDMLELDVLKAALAESTCWTAR